VDWLTLTDWLAVFDTNTENMWLDLSVTNGLSVASIISQLNTTYSGFRLATSSEVLSLMQGAFPSILIPDSSYYGPHSGVYGEVWRNTFGHTDAGSSYGIYLNGATGIYAASGVHYNKRVVHAFNRSADINYAASTDGVFLIKDSTLVSVPIDASAPMAFGGVLLAGMGLLFRRRRG
jgi:hypothetical protein